MSWNDFSDHGGEVHDIESLNDLGMAALTGVKMDHQEGASSGGTSEAYVMTDGEESEGAKGRKSVPQSRRKVKVKITSGCFLNSFKMFPKCRPPALLCR